jgi:hypothetical protein
VGLLVGVECAELLVVRNLDDFVELQFLALLVSVAVTLEDIAVELGDEGEGVVAGRNEETLLVVGVGGVHELEVVEPTEEVLVDEVDVLAQLLLAPRDQSDKLT